jgi:carbonic anhydrase
VEASLKFAVNELSVRNVVICGHSGCGAMTALLAGPAGNKGKDGGEERCPVDAWLDHGRPSLERFLTGHPVQVAAEQAGFGAVDQLAMVNVAVQLERLQRHGNLQDAVRNGDIHVTGLFYDLATARVLQITPTGISHLDPLPRAEELAPA